MRWSRTMIISLGRPKLAGNSQGHTLNINCPLSKRCSHTIKAINRRCLLNNPISNSNSLTRKTRTTCKRGRCWTTGSDFITITYFGDHGVQCVFNVRILNVWLSAWEIAVDGLKPSHVVVRVTYQMNVEHLVVLLRLFLFTEEPMVAMVRFVFIRLCRKAEHSESKEKCLHTTKIRIKYYI